ncbi:hypothetical protein Pint_09722 [Pistacia integerrima]|uniref:Uncharacterized protein n=1 Tax=Pistacia integerrima TaxID=434235 RepID=A0ACC0XHK7_9ROSI|nr:hypothetical protein Pint_09722 [Pistacia integerrima]
MSASLSLAVSATTATASSLKLRNCKSLASLNSNSTLRFNLLSSPRSLSRKLYRVQATVLQDEEEKVVVEESFQPKSFPEIEEKESHGNDSVIKILDTLYRERDYARFFVLETIARVPYFAFISVLHLYESFGWWRQADYLKVHFAESWNEMHHLLIMEELGGDSWWFDRFLAQHIAVFYYFMTVFMYAISPRMAYHFSECVENHAFETYDKFLKARGEELKGMPAPEVAVKYYTGGDLYLFDEFQTDRIPNTRRPKIENLYDVFVNIRDDEAEHCKTMKACQTPGNLRSPHSYLEDDSEDESGRHSSMFCLIATGDTVTNIYNCGGLAVHQRFGSTAMRDNILGDVYSVLGKFLLTSH